MDIEVQKIYIVCSDANLMLMRKLKGQSAASHCQVLVVSSILDLPKTPPTNSYLVIDYELISLLQHTNTWKSVFTISNVQRPSHKNINFVTIAAEQKFGESLPRLLQCIFPLINKQISHSAWHSNHNIYPTSLHQLGSELNHWSKQFKLYSHPCIVRLKQFFDGMKPSGLNQTHGYDACTLDIKFDGVHCDISVDLFKNGHCEHIQSTLQELANGPWFQHLMLQKSDAHNRLMIRFSTLAQNLPCIYLQTNESDAVEDGLSLERKVS